MVDTHTHTYNDNDNNSTSLLLKAKFSCVAQGTVKKKYGIISE